MDENYVVVTGLGRGQTPYILIADATSWRFFKAGASPVRVFLVALPLLIGLGFVLSFFLTASKATSVGPIRFGLVALLALVLYVYGRRSRTQALKRVEDALRAARKGLQTPTKADHTLEFDSIEGLKWGMGMRGVLLIRDSEGTVQEFKFKAEPEAREQLTALVKHQWLTEEEAAAEST